MKHDAVGGEDRPEKNKKPIKNGLMYGLGDAY